MSNKKLHHGAKHRLKLPRMHTPPSLMFRDSPEASKEDILGMQNWQVASLTFRKICIHLKETEKAFTIVSCFSKENVKLRGRGEVLFFCCLEGNLFNLSIF